MKQKNKNKNAEVVLGPGKAGWADFGLDTVYFSVESVCKTMIMNQELAGTSKEDRNKRGRSVE